ncbi:conserved hypothetical protein [Pediculus humanus corporis]|uniref:Uncharacterized protein n=1 Tax=Pediculus humanus subsp. corporis TaxID=121224 RepID=E0VC48_PEDHC|nr:uncharacterized protein Phum_PHUM079890 [Pediculus humanus corporis]EEB10954.1 conserved hypothetical protein [Pediculus humanus corporis]
MEKIFMVTINLVNDNSSKPSKSNNDTSLKEKNEIDNYLEDHNENSLQTKVWSEKYEVSKVLRENKFYNQIDDMTSFLKQLYRLNAFPKNIDDVIYLMKKRKMRRQVLLQQYLPGRKAILKPDLAAAHFIISRGGIVKFKGQKNWISLKESSLLPSVYSPGYFVEAINAEKTNLCFEGLQNICQLEYLKSLSLKGLKEINDWCLDWITNEFQNQIEDLDISFCTNITHRGIPSLHRFENLKTLTLEGISEAPEFKLACLINQRNRLINSQEN